MKLLLLLSLFSLTAHADGLLSNNAMVRSPGSTALTTCGPDIQKLCSGVAPGGAMACLKSQDPKKLSTACASKLGSNATGKQIKLPGS